MAYSPLAIQTCTTVDQLDNDNIAGVTDAEVLVVEIRILVVEIRVKFKETNRIV